MESGSSRFRTGQVHTPATLAERIRNSALDGEVMQDLVVDELRTLLRNWDVDGISSLLGAVRTHDDYSRVYAIHVITARMLIAAAADAPHDGSMRWAQYYDALPALVMPFLESAPPEPTLLNLVGIAYYELGETAAARRIFEVVKEHEPEITAAHEYLKACKQRQQNPQSVAVLSADCKRLSAEFRGATKRLCEQFTRLADRTISLCMIVKDEEEMLPGCLEAVAGHVDEIIIVDTGSIDSTPDIARSFGATVIDFPWTGSFADARNASIEHATSDWLLFLDADEHMVEGDAAQLRQLARRTWVEGYQLQINNYTGEIDTGDQTVFLAVRLVQHRPEYQWSGRIHEQITASMPNWLGERFQWSPVRLEHYGYLSSIRQGRDKADRNLSLLLADIEQGDDSAFAYFNVGSEYGAIGDWDTARGYLVQAMERARLISGWQQVQFTPMLVSRLVSSYVRGGMYDEADALISEMLAVWPDFTDLLHHRALMQYEQGRLDAALVTARACLEQGDAPSRYVSIQGTGTFKSHALIARIMQDLGHTSDALDELAHAFDRYPEQIQLLLQRVELHLAHAASEEVYADLAARLDRRKPSATIAVLLGTMFFERGQLEYADSYYRQALELQPRNVPARVGSAEIALAQGRVEEALGIISAVDPLEPLAPWAARTWFLALVVAGAVDELADPLAIITSSELFPTGIRAMYAAWHAAITGTPALLAADPLAAQQIIDNLEALARLERADEFERLASLLTQAVPDERHRHMLLAGVYLRRSFADMAGEELMYVAQHFGPSSDVLTGLGKVATMKEMWDDAVVFLTESLEMDPAQRDARTLLGLVQERSFAGNN